MSGQTPEKDRVPKREEIGEAYKWRPEHIFPSDDAWEEEFSKVDKLTSTADRYRGKVGESAANLLGALKLNDELFCRGDRLAQYALMRRDEDNENPKYQAMAQRVMALAAKARSAMSYVQPEILETSEEAIRRYLESEPELKVYTHLLDDILRGKKHVLPAPEERILAELEDIASDPDTIFTMLENADMRFGTVSEEDGKEVELTYGRYPLFLRSHDRKLRREAFEKLHQQYLNHKNTIAATYAASVKLDAFFARMRRFGSSLEAKLHPDNVPVSVYDNLIATVRANLPSMHRSFRLRRKLLGVEKLHMYDLLAPIVRDVAFEIPYEEGRKIVKAGLYPLGEEYGAALDEAFEGGWIDVYENQGKISGAYVRNVYGTHPYVLLNYQGTMDDLFTLAHELGHAMHSYYTDRTQPYVYSDYSIFVAEVASMVNEALLVNYLLDSETDPRRRLYIVGEHINQFRITLFRQTMFAEFEKLAHERLETGGALTAESLSEIYRRLLEEYFAGEVHIDEHLVIEWARVSHFYNSFYVYKYATGFAAAIAISQSILSGKEGAVERYLEFLSSGSSDYPLNLLARAGVDMTTPRPIEEALGLLDRLLDEAEVLAAQYLNERSDQ